MIFLHFFRPPLCYLNFLIQDSMILFCYLMQRFFKEKKEIAAEKREKKKKPQEKSRIIPRNLSLLKINIASIEV